MSDKNSKAGGKKTPGSSASGARSSDQTKSTTTASKQKQSNETPKTYFQRLHEPIFYVERSADDLNKQLSLLTIDNKQPSTSSDNSTQINNPPIENITDNISKTKEIFSKRATTKKNVDEEEEIVEQADSSKPFTTATDAMNGLISIIYSSNDANPSASSSSTSTIGVPILKTASRSISRNNPFGLCTTRLTTQSIC